MQVDKRRTRKLVISLFCIFLAPLFVAWYLFFNADHHILSASNNGELIAMPFNVSALELHDYNGDLATNKKHKWIILYWKKSCEQKCKKVVEKLLKVRMVLGKDMARTKAWLATATKIDPIMLRALENVQNFNTEALLMPNSSEAKQLLMTGNRHILLIDPSGNVMMRYQEDVTPKSIHSDLKRLLKLSRMG